MEFGGNFGRFSSGFVHSPSSLYSKLVEQCGLFLHWIRPSPITPGDAYRPVVDHHECVPSTGAMHSCGDDTSMFGIGGEGEEGDSLRASSSILTTSFPGGNTASALVRSPAEGDVRWGLCFMLR